MYHLNILEHIHNRPLPLFLPFTPPLGPVIIAMNSGHVTCLYLKLVPGTSVRGTVRGGEGREGSESGPLPSNETDTNLHNRYL